MKNNKDVADELSRTCAFNRTSLAIFSLLVFPLMLSLRLRCRYALAMPLGQVIFLSSLAGTYCITFVLHSFAPVDFSIL